MTPGVTRKVLDQRSCSDPKCTHEADALLFIHSRCHFEAALEASYERKTGCVYLKCAACKRLVARIQVAEGK